MNPMSSLRVAIVADWLIGGGAERVVEELHRLYPNAPIYTSYCSDDWRQRLDNKVVTGYLQRWPFGTLRKYIGILRIYWYRHLDLKGFDIVISTTGNGEAKHIRTPKGTKHICYCFSPVHYYWRHYQTYIKNPGFGSFNGLARLGLRILDMPFRNLDYRAAQSPIAFIAISKHIQNDIKEFYGRDSVIIAPPVNLERFASRASAPLSQRTGFITMGRQTAYKRTELIVDACTQKNLPLKVVGTGPQHDDLVKRAGPSVEFLTTVTDEQMPKILAGAQAFLFAATEDFGVAPVEALAAGLPVIAYRGGGALDYVIEGKTGLFFDKPTAESLGKAITTFSPKAFDPQAIQAFAAGFSATVFKQKIQDYIDGVTK